MDYQNDLRNIQVALRKIIFPTKEVQESIKLVNDTINAILSDLSQVQQMFTTDFAPILKQLKSIKAPEFTELHHTLIRLSELQLGNIVVPTIVLNPFQELTSKLSKTLELQTAHNDLGITLNVRINEQTNNKPLHWAELINILNILLVLATFFYSENSNNKQHEEMMNEERKQTQIQVETLATQKESLATQKELVEQIAKLIRIVEENVPAEDIKEKIR